MTPYYYEHLFYKMLINIVYYYLGNVLKRQYTKGHTVSWTVGNMESALSALKGKNSLRRVAKSYGIPKSTLHDNSAGKVNIGSRRGPNPVLSVDEEQMVE